MYAYIKGTVKDIESNYIVVENNGIGYEVFTANPYSYSINEEYTVYLYHYVREDENSLYGFKDKKDKDLFLKLIGVKGLGCKMALPMFASTSADNLIDAIERENILYLKRFPKIGDKVARQIILDLKGKLARTDGYDEQISSELTEALKGLGYKATDIKKVIKYIDNSLSIEEQIREALKLLLK